MIKEVMKYRKNILFVIATICLAGSLYLYFAVGILSFYILIGLSIITILLPLIAGLFLYKGRAARFWIGLGIFAFLCALIFTVDASATQSTFKAICEEMPEYLYENRGIDGYSCFMTESAPWLRMSSISSVIGEILYFPYVLVLFTNLLHTPYLGWRAIMRRKSTQA